LQRSPHIVITNQYSFVNNPTSNSLPSAAIYSNLISTATANCCIIALSTATQQQDTRRELAHTVGVDGYPQSQRSGLAVYLLT
jgi:hypothetical protein